MDDQELIKRIARRDQSAFLALYERYSSRVYTLILHMIADRMLGEEILQETFLRLWRRAGQYDPGRGSVMIWLLSIARYTTLERLRFESHRRACQMIMNLLHFWRACLSRSPRRRRRAGEAFILPSDPCLQNRKV